MGLLTDFELFFLKTKALKQIVDTGNIINIGRRYYHSLFYQSLQ